MFETVVRAILSLCGSIGLSVIGFREARGWEWWLFGTGILGAVALTGLEVRELYYQSKFIEPKTVRRRCHRVLSQMAKALFPPDDGLRLVIFLPQRSKGNPLLVPIVCFNVSRPMDFVPTTKVQFKTDSSTLIIKAWKDPGELYWNEIPSAEFGGNVDQARGFFQSVMKVPAATCKKLSQQTLLHTKSMANVAFTVPLSGTTEPIGLLAVCSTVSETFKAEQLDKVTLRAYLQTIALMLASFD